MCLLNLSFCLIKVMRRNQSTSLPFWSPCTVLYLWSDAAYELPSALLAHSWGVLKTVSTCILIAWALAMTGHDSGKLSRPEFSSLGHALCQRRIYVAFASFQKGNCYKLFCKAMGINCLTTSCTNGFCWSLIVHLLDMAAGLLNSPITAIATSLSLEFLCHTVAMLGATTSTFLVPFCSCDQP